MHEMPKKIHIFREKTNQIFQISQGHFFHLRTSSQAYIDSLTRHTFSFTIHKPSQPTFQTMKWPIRGDNPHEEIQTSSKNAAEIQRSTFPETEML